ncbi:dethiobiotin synthase [Pedobacter frigiditerrae]|uniref:ATP-dependent dethiobiotin synthetase BioD n=1 Tax=Pedobacter frigiditerrae TaxID=2530452 RepID=A0A4R0MTW1_9SPHI|nr:dethiobiotin synthase [Pedobacter frigiditerrae]TCC90515.1 dethiobiotin synthase [Pedobacter frigiditerrae]
MAQKYFITGIGTGIGKTIVSAILIEKLNADYWKPIQSGDLSQSDSLAIESLISNEKTKIHPETYRLNNPLSPHLSAKLDGIEIALNQFILPDTDNNLIVEGAGGLMVPLNNKELILDLIKYLNLEVILISQNYLGSINHTLLTINTLRQHNICIKGIIFNGEANSESESYILNYTQINHLGNIPTLKNLDKTSIIEAGKSIDLI